MHNRKSIFSFPLAVLLLVCCNDNADKETAKNDVVFDSVAHNTPADGNTGALNKRADTDEEVRAERRQMLMTQIDSTYNAISLLDDAKTEMTEVPASQLSTAERNQKSKAIFNINLLQNELTRSLDASILANLKIKTNELAAICTQLEQNTAHLQKVTEKLNKATKCIGRLTDLLALGLSKGIIKPVTLPGAKDKAMQTAATAN